MAIKDIILIISVELCFPACQWESILLSVNENKCIESSCLYTLTLFVWWECTPRKSCSRTIDDDILARPVKDTDLLLLGSAHPVPKEERWMRWQFMARRVLNSPEQWAHLNPTAWGMLGCPAARITHGTWSSLLGPGIVVACSRKFRITDKQSICSVLCMATVSFANLCSHHGRFENLHQQNMQRVSVEMTTWK